MLGDWLGAEEVIKCNNTVNLRKGNIKLLCNKILNLRGKITKDFLSPVQKPELVGQVFLLYLAISLFNI
jgi:hypothetical protein